MTYMFILKCALKLIEEIILYYDARSKKHKKKEESVQASILVTTATVSSAGPNFYSLFTQRL